LIGVLLCALTTVFLLVPVPASQPAPAPTHVGIAGVTRPDWIAFTATMARHYGVRPDFAIGVAFAEGSDPKTGRPFRFGHHGRYWLPWGIHEYVIRERHWPVWDIYVQTEVAVRALSIHISRARRRHLGISVAGAEDKALHRYNASCTAAYIRRVRQGQRMYGGLVR